MKYSTEIIQNTCKHPCYFMYTLHNVCKHINNTQKHRQCSDRTANQITQMGPNNTVKQYILNQYQYKEIHHIVQYTQYLSFSRDQ